jgi:DNA-binding MarR family transcriptional regulator
VDAARFLDLVERLGTLLRAERRGAAGVPRLEPVHWQVLGYLARCNRYSNTPAALAAYLGATRGTTSQSLTVLERRGLVRRRPDPADGRGVRLELTARGRRLLEREEGMRRARLELLSEVGAERVAEAVRVLEAFLRGLQRASGYRTFGLCRTCRHLLREGPGRFRCGLTLEPLAPAETEQICHEHTDPAA